LPDKRCVPTEQSDGGVERVHDVGVIVHLEALNEAATENSIISEHSSWRIEMLNLLELGLIGEHRDRVEKLRE